MIQEQLSKGIKPHEIWWNYLTRTYGLRQQAMYIAHYDALRGLKRKIEK